MAMLAAASLAELHELAGATDVVVACGVFDGVHCGHQSIMRELASLALRCRALPVVVTFDPHPRAILHPHAVPALLSSAQQKLRWFREHGVAGVVCLPFSPAMAALAPRDFLTRHLLSPQVKVHGVCVGCGWRFGAHGGGNTELLAAFGAELGFETVCVPELIYYGEPVSSTRIRRALSHGNLPLAARMLGRNYAVEGLVEHGKGLGGKELKCPTANVDTTGKVIPPYGVYAVRAVVSPELAAESPTAWGGAAYIGMAPTLPEADGRPARQPRLEVHLFDFQGDLYGRCLEVEFTEFVRPDRVFPSVAELRRQLDVDLAHARQVADGQESRLA